MKKAQSKTRTDLTRRHFVKHGAGALVAAGCIATLRPSQLSAEPHATPPPAADSFICPPCGLECDKLRFDKPGNCPQCGMTLIPADGAGIVKVAMFVYDGVEIIDIAGPWEVFGTAGFLVHTVAEKPDPLTLVFGQKIVPDFTFANAPKADVLLVPGGGYSRQMKNDAVLNFIKTKANEAKYVMSVCTGAFLLGQAGLLAGQAATCTYGMVEDFANFPNTKVVYDARFVESGKIITTAGLTSGIDGALHLIAKLSGAGAAQSAALNIEYNWNPEGRWTRNMMADRFLPDGLAYAAPTLKGAKATMISTQGDSSRWEAKILVSDPSKPESIISLLRERITSSSGQGGMNNRISHLRSGPTFVETGKPSEVRWKFTDDRGQAWSALGVVAPAPEGKDKFILTLSLSASASTN